MPSPHDPVDNGGFDDCPTVEDPVTPLFRQTVLQIPSIFGRLSYLASLRDPRDLRYRHVLFSRVLHRVSAHEILLRTHRQVFHSWLLLTLEEQTRDFCKFLGDRREECSASALGLWARRAARDIAPPGTLLPELEQFETEMELIVELTVGPMPERDSEIERGSGEPCPVTVR